MAVKLKNDARSLLGASIGPGATIIVVPAGHGMRFPTLTDDDDWFPLAVQDATGATEYMRCTARSGDAMTVTRAQEGSLPLTLAAGCVVELRITSALLDELRNLHVKAADVDITTPEGMSAATVDAAVQELHDAVEGVASDLTTMEEGLPTYPLAVDQGGTGGATEADARAGLGLGTLATQDDDTANLTAPLKINDDQVVGERVTGWVAPTGTATRTTYATYAGQTIAATPTQAEVQAMDDHIKILSERLKAALDDLTTHGLIGA
jgi:hypothetical protein